MHGPSSLALSLPRSLVRRSFVISDFLYFLLSFLPFFQRRGPCTSSVPESGCGVQHTDNEAGCPVGPPNPPPISHNTLSPRTGCLGNLCLLGGGNSEHPPPSYLHAARATQEGSDRRRKETGSSRHISLQSAVCVHSLHVFAFSWLRSGLLLEQSIKPRNHGRDLFHHLRRSAGAMVMALRALKVLRPSGASAQVLKTIKTSSSNLACQSSCLAWLRPFQRVSNGFWRPIGHIPTPKRVHAQVLQLRGGIFPQHRIPSVCQDVHSRAIVEHDSTNYSRKWRCHNLGFSCPRTKPQESSMNAARSNASQRSH